MKRRITVAMCLVLAGLAGCASLPKHKDETEKAAPTDSASVMLPMLKLFAITLHINSFYYKDVDMNWCVERILENGVSACADKYSFFVDKKNNKKDEIRDAGNFIGVGLVFVQKGGKIKITSVVKNSPAEKTGILPGDEIVAVSSIGARGKLISVSGLGLEEIVDLMDGNVGEKMLVSVSRNGKVMKFEMERAEVKDPSVIFSKLNGNIGYVKITEFIRPTEDDFEAAVSSLSQNGVNTLVIDLRDNPGGFLDSAVGINTFFKNDLEPIAYMLGKNQPEVEIVPNVEKLGIFQDLKVVVLINKNSASAAEILSGWLKEDFGAPVIGKATFGKDLVQTIYEFSDGSALHLTTERYLIGSKRISIGGIGVLPTLEVENPKGQKDRQMQKAIEIARQLAVLSK